ncbi:MAG: hypothetical protein KAR06_04150 [Deltaproteobacteria bacterium]|nr:hypothetical protein [Deltaproteobacteria bacterium]
MAENTNKDTPEENKDLAKKEGPDVAAGFGSAASFAVIQRQAGMLAKSDLVPKEFKGNIANCVIAMELANRLGASPMSVMQNLYIVHGKPSWSSQFIIAAVNSTGNFSPIRYAITGEGSTLRCVAWAIEKATGERLEGPPITMEMADKEGWLKKTGSKWQTMPDLMIRYRAATLFGRLYAPEVLMGMQTSDEVADVGPGAPAGPTPEEVTNRFNDDKPEVTGVEVVEDEAPVEEAKPEPKAETPAGPTCDELCSEINKLNTVEEVTQWEHDRSEFIINFSKDQKDMIAGITRMRKTEIEEMRGAKKD